MLELFEDELRNDDDSFEEACLTNVCDASVDDHACIEDLERLHGVCLIIFFGIFLLGTRIAEETYHFIPLLEADLETKIPKQQGQEYRYDRIQDREFKLIDGNSQQICYDQSDNQTKTSKEQIRHRGLYQTIFKPFDKVHHILDCPERNNIKNNGT